MGSCDADGFLVWWAVAALSSYWHDRFAMEVTSQFKNFLPTTITVLRDGNWVVISPEELVEGDIVMLKACIRVPADIRVIEVSNAKVRAKCMRNVCGTYGLQPRCVRNACGTYGLQCQGACGMHAGTKSWDMTPQGT
jgi:hypothetical protein